MRISFLLFAASGLGLAAVTGCKKQTAPPAPPPPTVTVAKPVARKIVEHSEYTGRLAAIENVDVRPRVSGYITEIDFKDGALVKKGDLLFVIDPRPYQAALDQSQGQLKQAQAQQDLSNRNFTRAETLQATKVSSKEEFDQAATNRNQGEAQVATAQAAVDAAKLNLAFTRITAPIDGRVSREQVTVGNLVASDSTVLTNIVSVDPDLRLRGRGRTHRHRLPEDDQRGQGQGRARHHDPGRHRAGGRTGFSAPGQHRLRGQPDQRRHRHACPSGAISQQGQPACSRHVHPDADSHQRGEGRVAHHRPRGRPTRGRNSSTCSPTTRWTSGRSPSARSIDGLRVVIEGLKPDDQVIINGIMKVRPGAQVKAEQGKMEQFASDELQVKPIDGRQVSVGNRRGKNAAP